MPAKRKEPTTHVHSPAIEDYLRNFPGEEPAQRLRDLALLAGSAAGSAVLLARR